MASRGRGRDTAVAFIDALQRARACGPVRVEGRLPALWKAIGAVLPEAKTARAALAKLAEHGIVTRLSRWRWSMDSTTIEIGESATPPVAGLDQKRTPEPSPDRPRSPDRGHRAPGSPLPRARERIDLDHRVSRARPPWQIEPHPLVPRFVAAVERAGTLGIGRTWVVTLTVAPGVDLDAVGCAFAQRLGGLFSGVWLVPETSPKGRRHYHGVVVASGEVETLSAWQRSGGGISSAQRFDPIAPDDHWHLQRAVAYAMKRRHVEPGEVIASGVLASPWADGQEPPRRRPQPLAGGARAIATAARKATSTATLGPAAAALVVRPVQPVRQGLRPNRGSIW